MRTRIDSIRSWRALRAGCLVAALAVLVAACDDDDDFNIGRNFGRAVYGIDNTNNLIRFGSLRPDRVTQRGVISGLQPGEDIVGIDFRPADGRLYALGSSNRLYVVDTIAASAVQVGVGNFNPALDGTQFGIGFNPVADRLRVQSDSTQNLRINPNDGTVAAVDSPLAYAPGDAGAGTIPRIVGTAYTGSVNPPPGTTILFSIDSNRDALVTVPDPNNGLLQTVGGLGVNTTEQVGFAIAGNDGTALATLTPDGTRRSRLYEINLATGATTLIGTVGHNNPLHGIAVIP